MSVIKKNSVLKTSGCCLFGGFTTGAVEISLQHQLLLLLLIPDASISIFRVNSGEDVNKRNRWAEVTCRAFKPPCGKSVVSFSQHSEKSGRQSLNFSLALSHLRRCNHLISLRLCLISRKTRRESISSEGETKKLFGVAKLISDSLYQFFFINEGSSVGWNMCFAEGRKKSLRKIFLVCLFFSVVPHIKILKQNQSLFGKFTSRVRICFLWIFDFGFGVSSVWTVKSFYFPLGKLECIICLRVFFVLKLFVWFNEPLPSTYTRMH